MRVNFILRFAIALFFWSTIAASSAFATEHAKIIFATNLPEINQQELGDYSELASILENYRQQSSSTFFIFGGGSLGPSPMSSFDRGSHIIDILNSLEPDVMGATKREFSYFEDVLSLRSYEAAFPIVISNLFDSFTQGNLDGLYSSAIIQKDDYKIGVMSFIDQSVVEQYILLRTTIFNPCRVITNLSNQLRSEGVDLIIMLYAKVEDCYLKALQEHQIDLSIRTNILSTILSTDSILEHSRNVGVLERGQVLALDLNWEKNTPTSLSFSKEDLKLKEFPKNPEVFMQINGYTKRLDRLLDQPIGHIQSNLVTQQKTLRVQESAFGNFIADAIKEYTNADLGLINSGIIRGDKEYTKGSQLTRYDIAEELPFRSRVTLLNVNGQQLLDALESGFSRFEFFEGRFPQISGMTIEFDPEAQIGKRVVSLKVAGVTIVLDRHYSLATTDYLANGGDGYDSLVNAENIHFSNNMSPLVSDIVIRAIQKQKNITPQIESRIINLKQAQ